MSKSSIVYRKASEAFSRMAQPDYEVKNFLTKDDLPHISIAVGKLSSGGIHETMSTRSDRFYYFIEADNCKLTSDKPITIEADSVLFVPKKTKYTIIGNFKAVIINTPAFDKTKEIK